MKSTIVILLLVLVGCGEKGKDGKDGALPYKTVYCQGFAGSYDQHLLHVEWTQFTDGSRYIKCLVSFAPLVDGYTGITMSNSNFRLPDTRYDNICFIPLDGSDLSTYVEFTIQNNPNKAEALINSADYGYRYITLSCGAVDYSK